MWHQLRSKTKREGSFSPYFQEVKEHSFAKAITARQSSGKGWEHCLPGLTTGLESCILYMERLTNGHTFQEWKRMTTGTHVCIPDVNYETK